MLDLQHTKIFADGADLNSIRKHNENPLISGFTTNPTLMAKAGVTDYRDFAQEVLSIIGYKPISFEVFSDDFEDMARQARIIAEWGENVYVKIPITNTKGESSVPLIEMLTKEGIRVNVTAITTLEQVVKASMAIGDHDSFISVFAGRVADTGVDPVKLMEDVYVAISGWYVGQKIIWASPRQVLDVVNAIELQIDAITVTDDIIKKLPLIGKDLNEYSLQTVKMFFSDAQKSGFVI